MVFTCHTRAPRKFTQLSSPTSSDMGVQVPCECEARARNPPRRVTIRCTTRSPEDCEGTPTLRPGRLLNLRVDQGDCASSSPCSHHGTSHISRGSQLCTCLVHDVAPALMLTACRLLSLSIKTGTRCCKISDSQRYS